MELEDGKPEDAEKSLRLALSTYRAASEDERLDEHFAAQAQYYLGEVYREWFRALPLDPSKGDDEALQRDLEQKAEMLLSAQGHYLRAIRMGNDRWAVASGFRIGELYDELRSQLLDAPLPPGLDEEHAGGVPRRAAQARPRPRDEGDRRLRADALARRALRGRRSPVPRRRAGRARAAEGRDRGGREADDVGRGLPRRPRCDVRRSESEASPRTPRRRPPHSEPEPHAAPAYARSPVAPPSAPDLIGVKRLVPAVDGASR